MITVDGNYVESTTSISTDAKAHNNVTNDNTAKLNAAQVMK